MKKFASIFHRNIIAALLVLVVFSCNKKWDEYYAKPAYLQNGSLLHLLESSPDYREFVSLVKKTGYDSVLRSNGSFTVFALKNGSFAGIDTANVATLKKIIGMHIVNTSLYADGMNNNRILAASGKLLKFASTQTGQTVNTIAVKVLNSKALNGVMHEVERVILPMSNLYDVVLSNPELSVFKRFIDSSFTNVIDVEKNIRIGYDTSNKPIYQQPVIYKQISDYLAVSGVSDENVVRTMFMATNTAVNKALTNMLTARAGKSELIIPRLSTSHKDTTIGGMFFPNGMPYPGDTAILLNYLFNHTIIDKEIPALAGSDNSYTNIKGEQFTVSQSQVTTNGLPASNGRYYYLNDITLPEVVYRSRFMFLPFPKVQNPLNPNGPTIVNPNIIYSGGTNTSPSQSSNGTCYTGRYTRFNFNNVGGKVEFVFPFATKGYYRVNLKNFIDNNGSMVSAAYGSQPLKQNINTSTQYALGSVMIDVDLGIINVPADGPVKITFTCTGVSPRTAARYEFCVDLLELLPVPAP